MTNLNEIYKCSVCGNMVEVIHASGGTLVCCGQPMELLKEKTGEIGSEKHVPVIEIKKDKVTVKIGAIEHPMEEKHYIEWIELLADGKIYRKYLKPNDKPIAEFYISAKTVAAREYCNVHGLWKH
jgi:superoxide reductase